LVVDDEELACQGLRRKLLAVGGVGSVETCTDPVQAVSLLREGQFDLVFLDIKMPEMSGFDVLAHFPEIDRHFFPIFCTAFDDYATSAFEAAAIDYLVKPVDPLRLATSLARARRLMQAGMQPGLLNKVREAGLTGYLERIVVRYRGALRVVESREIEAIASEAHHAVAYTKTEEHVLESSLTSLEAQLDPNRFVRVHRAWVVQIGSVRDVGVEEIRLESGRKVPLSRRNRKLLGKMLGST
jgi:two-component system LytT family response regulator